jgi:ribosomal protein S18 acetylase RimI-like enzyme
LAGDLTVGLADYADVRDAADLLTALASYAHDPMGGGTPLATDVGERVVPCLAATPGAFSLLARIDDELAGFANCFTGFSTFAARPVVNIHDFGVLPRYRARGVGNALLAAIEAEAARRGACKLTLEVLSGNTPAKALYRSSGFGDYALDPAAGTAQFWEKKLS